MIDTIGLIRFIHYVNLLSFVALGLLFYVSFNNSDSIP